MAGFGPIACMGEVMVEVARGDGDNARLGVAGDSLNTAVYLARALGPGRVDYVTALGDDGQSDRILTALAREGIGTAHVARLPGAMPGLYMIDVDERGERRFSYWRSTSAARRMFLPESGLMPTALDRFGLLHLTGISIAILTPPAREGLALWLQGFRARGGRVYFDGNYRPALWPDPATARAEIARFTALADIAFPSLDDETALFGGTAEDVLNRHAKLGVRAGALKCGAAGALSLASGRHQPALPAKVVDTTAAGDSFDAGFLAAMDAGGDEAACLQAGAALAARVIATRGAILP